MFITNNFKIRLTLKHLKFIYISMLKVNWLRLLTSSLMHIILSFFRILFRNWKGRYTITLPSCLLILTSLLQPGNSFWIYPQSLFRFKTRIRMNPVLIPNRITIMIVTWQRMWRRWRLMKWNLILMRYVSVRETFRLCVSCKERKFCLRK